MKKISRRNFLLASGAVTIGAALAACGGSSARSTALPAALLLPLRLLHPPLLLLLRLLPRARC